MYSGVTAIAVNLRIEYYSITAIAVILSMISNDRGN